MAEYNAHRVLTKLYEELQGIGQKKRELKHQGYALAEEDDWHRTDVCRYVFDAVINKSNGNHFVFTYGETNRTWRHLAGVDEAVMYAKVNWKDFLRQRDFVYKDSPLKTWPDEENMDLLTDDQVTWIPHIALRKDYLVRSWEGEIAIRDGTDYKTYTFQMKKIPQEYVLQRNVSKSRIATMAGIPILLETDESPESIRAQGLTPTGHQEVIYKNNVVGFLVNHVKDVLARPLKK